MGEPRNTSQLVRTVLTQDQPAQEDTPLNQDRPSLPQRHKTQELNPPLSSRTQARTPSDDITLPLSQRLFIDQPASDDDEKMTSSPPQTAPSLQTELLLPVRPPPQHYYIYPKEDYFPPDQCGSPTKWTQSQMA